MKKILVKIFRRFLIAKKRTLVATMPQLGRPRLIDVFENIETNEYIRLSTLELCGHEVRKKSVAGAIAELGVYRGTFASMMNQLLPEKKFYLFDTFGGFDAKQEAVDKLQHCHNHIRDFTDTTVSLVLSRMRTPENCVVRKGLFPTTAFGVEEQFCLVSIDADLFEPIYLGLKWFWPRMLNGGFILVHDYNNSNFPGAHAAVNRFSCENKVPFTPVSDSYGTAIFAK